MKLRFNSFFWAQLLLVPLIVFSSFSGCEGEEDEDVILDIPATDDDDTPSNPQSQAGYYLIPEESLVGWDEGIFYSNEDGTEHPYYIVSKTDSVGDIIVCLNETENTDAERAVIFHFSKDGDVLKASFPGYSFEAQSGEDDVYFIVYNDKHEALGGFTVPYESTGISVTDSASRTRSPFFNSKGEFSVSKTLNFGKFVAGAAEVIGERLQAIYNLDQGDYGALLSDFLTGAMVVPFAKTFLGKLILPIAVQQLMENLYEMAKEIYMGTAGIEITSVKRTSSTTISVDGKILDIESIPLLLITVEDGVTKYEENIVKYGIAVGKNEFPGYYLNNNCSELRDVSMDDEEFSFTFYMEETPGEGFYFRPFLIPEFKVKGEDDLLPDPYTCIRYGKAKKFMDMCVELSNFMQLSCEREGGKYNVQFTIDGKIPGLFDDLATWGFDVKSKTGSYESRHYANKSTESYIPPTEKSFTCNISFTESDIETIGGEKLADVIITPFVSFRNSLPPMEFYEEQNYTVTITTGLCPDDNHPHAIDLGLPSGTKWACCNVGASSPEECGGYYAWGETEEKEYYDITSYKYAYLNPNPTYYDDMYIFVNIGTNISGTEYDVAHLKWGNGYCIPTADQIEELQMNCKHGYFESYRGVEGYYYTASNGNRIFIPVSGHGPDGGNECISRVMCWSATLNNNGFVKILDIGGVYPCYRHGGRTDGLTVRPVRK